MSTKQKAKKLKAYEVRDDYEGHCVIRFATNNATARREGANELDIEWESVEHCRRRPEFDHYAPGPVPPLVLIEHGWWFECLNCGRRVSEYMADELRDDGLDPDDFKPVEEGRHVYCSQACCAKEYAKRRANKAAESALIEVFESKFPDCAIKHVHVYGDRVEVSERSGGSRCSIRFIFPGGQYPATWEFGESQVWVTQYDADAFRARYGSQQAA